MYLRNTYLLFDVIYVERTSLHYISWTVKEYWLMVIVTDHEYICLIVSQIRGSIFNYYLFFIYICFFCPIFVYLLVLFCMYRCNSTLDDTGHILSTPPSLTTSSLKLKFFIITFSMPALALILRGLTVRMESLLLVSKNVLPSLLPAWSSVSLYFYLSFLLEVCSHCTCP